MDGKELYHYMFDFTHTHSFSETFELYGLSDLNFVYNSNSFFIAMIVVTVGVILMAVIN